MPLNEIKVFLSENMRETLFVLVEKFPSNSNFILQKNQYLNAENSYYSSLISETEFDVRRARILQSVLFFLDKLSLEEIRKVDNALFGMSEKRILFIAATPLNIDPLQADLEYSSITDSINGGSYRHNFKFEPLFAAQLGALTEKLSAIRPRIIHFTGHAGLNGLVLRDKTNKISVIDNDSLDLLFRHLDFHVECVFLNACYSSTQAKFISKRVSYAIGMSNQISDLGSIQFAIAFYGILSNSQKPDYTTIFKLAQIAVRSEIGKEIDIPELWKEGEIIS